MIAALRSKGSKILGVMGLMFMTTLVYADEHTYKPSEQGAEQTLKQGEKWETDEVLRLSMDNIRHALIASQDSIKKERLSAQDYQRLAKVIDKNVADIVKNCKLSKEADRAFHIVVLADLSGGAELMRASPKIQVQRAGALGVLQSLRNYGEYFQHPDWNLGVTKVH